MLVITDEMIDEARDLIANGEPEAVGYRVMVKSLFAVTELEISQKKQFETLSQSGFQTKTNEQAERESKGTHFGIVVSLGGFAFGGSHLGKENWVEEGDVAIFDRYAGVGIELPTGSGNEFRFMNDESIIGRMRAKND
jgi:co-chaperonin GroES (HSP10)